MSSHWLGSNFRFSSQKQQGKKFYWATSRVFEETTEGYKIMAGKKSQAFEFQVGDVVWAILTKDRFSVGEYNKFSAKKIRPLEIIEKINSNA